MEKEALKLIPDAKLEEELIVRPTRKLLFGIPIENGFNRIEIYLY